MDPITDPDTVEDRAAMRRIAAQAASECSDVADALTAYGAASVEHTTAPVIELLTGLRQRTETYALQIALLGIQAGVLSKQQAAELLGIAYNTLQARIQRIASRDSTQVAPF